MRSSRDTANLENIENLLKTLFPDHPGYTPDKPAPPPAEGHARPAPASNKKGKRRTRRR